MKLISIIKLLCFILMGVYSSFLSSSFQRNRFQNYQNPNNNNPNSQYSHNNNLDIQNNQNNQNIQNESEYQTEEEIVSNLEEYIKNLRNEIITKKPMYSKIILPNIDKDIQNNTIYVKNFDESDLNNGFIRSKSKIHSLISENLEDIKLRYFPTESKNIELNSNLKLIENELSLKKQDLVKQQEQISQINLRKEKEQAETKSKTNFYKENTDKVLNKTMTIFNNINQIKTITDDYSSKYDLLKDDNEKMFEKVKEFSRQDLKSLEVKEELILFLRELQNSINHTNSTNSTNTIKVSKSDKLINELNLKNILRKNHTEDLIESLLNSNLDDNQSLNNIIDKIDDISLQKLSSLKENANSMKLSEVREFFINIKRSTSNKTIELNSSNKRLKKELEKAKNKYKENSNELVEVKNNNEGLIKVRKSYQKLLQEERDKSTFLTNKISILNSDLKKKMLRLKEIVNIEPKIQSIESKLKENLKETKNVIEDSSIDTLINNINEIVNQENLIFKTNKLKPIK